MSQPFAVFILMSNYFHDVATAMLIACSFALWIVIEKFGVSGDAEKRVLFRRFYKAINYVVIFSWIWIIAAGVIRIMTFRSFEWHNAVEKHHEPALLVKYVIAGTMIICGAYSWYVLRGRAKALIGRNDI